MKPVFVALVVTSLMAPCLHASNYQGQEKREIKSLSTQDIESIEEGKGWGMAKPAELNGYPGPRHVLDLAEELKLSTEQQIEMEKLFEVMRTQAIAVGERYLEDERRLEDAFRSKQISPDSLKVLIDTSAQARADLRHIHLSTHLKATKLLSRSQITSYNQLRGYDGASAQHHMH